MMLRSAMLASCPSASLSSICRKASAGIPESSSFTCLPARELKTQLFDSCEPSDAGHARQR
ncbi:Uncharacterised protein [Mycobacteroides abscessus subsp. abscessus]|nr:Uncharacterised protein [Mycobacteroides abscessus subsp. abscessus]